MDITIGSKPIGRIVLELYEDLAPNAVANFISLVNTSKSLNYKNTCMTTVLKNFIISGGGFDGFGVDSNDPGNVSVVNDGALFHLENPQAIDGPFLLCTSNNDVNANGSKFFITTYPQPHLTGKHSVFGEVQHGKSVIREIERVDTDKSNSPIQPVTIVDCGVWHDGDEVPIYNACYDPIGGDIYEEYPEDDIHIDKDSSELVYNASVIIKESGSSLFKNGRYQHALFKYVKSLRYVSEYIPDDEQHPDWYAKYHDLEKKLYLNLSLVNLKLEDYKRTVVYCDYLLELDNVTSSENAKGYYRKGTALLNMNQPKLAIEMLTKAKQNAPNDTSIDIQINVAHDMMNKLKETERAKYKKFFTS